PEKIVIRYEDLAEPDSEVNGRPPPEGGSVGRPLSITRSELRPPRSSLAPIPIAAAALVTVALGLALFLIVGRVFNAARAEANLRYWNALLATDAQSATPRGPRSEGSLQDDATALGSEFHAAARKIATLDVKDVDPDLVELGSQKRQDAE